MAQRSVLGSRAGSRAYVGLGGNEGDRLALLRSAACAVGAAAGLQVLRGSAIYETRPIGPSTRPFFNAAIEVQVDADLEPAMVLDTLLAIERDHGRVRRVRWQARTVDLDLLAWVDPGPTGSWRAATCEGPPLTLPHPRAAERDFVLAPLCDLVPDALLLPDRHGRATSPRALLDALPQAERTILRRHDEPLLV